MGDGRNVKTLAGIAIGDELLSGKVKEENMSFLIQESRSLGIRLNTIHLLPDHISLLAEHLLQASNRFDYVITSGGLGPTHDDLTMEAVSTAFDISIERNNTYEETLRNVYGPDVDETILKMADMPEGIEFEWGEMLDIPAARFRNIFILPGQPRLFRSKFSAIKEELRTGTSFHCAKLFLSIKESEIADVLTDLQNTIVDVEIGSYPSPWEKDYQTMITFESTEEEVVKQAVEQFQDRIDQKHVKRAEQT